MIWYLDLDGVIVEFTEEILEYYGKPRDLTLIKHYWDIFRACGVSKKELWKTVNNKLGREFWAGLKKTQWADDLISGIKDFDSAAEINFATSPTLHWSSFSGKAQWVKENYPKIFNNGSLILIRKKDKLSRQETILIDDRPSHVEKFNKYGGIAVMMPQPYNSNGKVTDPDTVVVSILAQVEQKMQKWT